MKILESSFKNVKLPLPIFTIFLLVCLILFPLKLNGQTDTLFQGSCDVGNLKHKGSYELVKETVSFHLKGSGKNMWFTNDEFFIVWRKVKGNFKLNSTIEWIGKGVEPHRKAGLIIRENLEPGSKYISIANHGDGLISMQYRPSKDSTTKEIKTVLTALSLLQMEKIDNKITTRGAIKGNPLIEVGTLEMNFDSEEFYVGLFVCAHNPDVIEEAVFSNTTLTFHANKGTINQSK